MKARGTHRILQKLSTGEVRMPGTHFMWHMSKCGDLFDSSILMLLRLFDLHAIAGSLYTQHVWHTSLSAENRMTIATQQGKIYCQPFTPGPLDTNQSINQTRGFSTDYSVCRYSATAAAVWSCNQGVTRDRISTVTGWRVGGWVAPPIHEHCQVSSCKGKALSTGFPHWFKNL